MKINKAEFIKNITARIWKLSLDGKDTNAHNYTGITTIIKAIEICIKETLKNDCDLHWSGIGTFRSVMTKGNGRNIASASKFTKNKIGTIKDVLTIKPYRRVRFTPSKQLKKYLKEM